MDLDLLAGLANRLKGLLAVKSTDIDVAVAQGRNRWACARVSQHDVVIAMRRAGANASWRPTRAGGDTG